MAHTYSSLLCHCVFSPKNRENISKPELRERLWPYMGGIARENGMKALNIGGPSDHVHLLLSLPPKLAVSKAVQLIKGGSSKWVSENSREHRNFEWQEGYGAFSIGISQMDQTMAYINGQESHHKKKTFREEYLDFLHKHGIKYDERYVLD